MQNATDKIQNQQYHSEIETLFRHCIPFWCPSRLRRLRQSSPCM